MCLTSLNLCKSVLKLQISEVNIYFLLHYSTLAALNYAATYNKLHLDQTQCWNYANIMHQ